MHTGRSVASVEPLVTGHIFVAPGLPDVPSPAHRAAVYEEMARVLGAIHRVDPQAAGLGAFGKPDDYSRRQLERWSRQYYASVTTPEAPVGGAHSLCTSTHI